MTIRNDILILKLCKPIIPIFDVLFSCVIVGPLVIIYWMSTWKLYDFYVTPDEPEISAAISFIIGFGGQFVIIYYQDELAIILTFENHKWINMIVSKLYTLIYAQTTINLWRGMWKFIDMYSPEDTATACLNIVQNSIILMLSKTYRNSISTPLIVATDGVENNYKIPTYSKRVVNWNDASGDKCWSFKLFSNLRKLMEAGSTFLTAQSRW